MTEKIIWQINIEGNLQICTLPRIDQMSAYILLEQEDWFEDEIDFVRKFITGEMFVLDIGANHGVYALSIARLLSTGHVFAFEPTSSPAQKLMSSISLNGLAERITLIQAGLSSETKQARIGVSLNSELNSLYSTGTEFEEIQLLALDEFFYVNEINQTIDFVKLDAEGEEINVLKGGKRFFTEQSPLVMFELKHGNQVNHQLIGAFKEFGYQIYRLLPDVNLLVKFQDSFSDGYQLNLFACKPDRANKLNERGLLVDASTVEDLLSSNLRITLDWENQLQELPFSTQIPSEWFQDGFEIRKEYLASMSACLNSYKKEFSPAERYAMIVFALHTIEQLIKEQRGDLFACLLLRLHLLHISGRRSVAVQQAAALLKVSEAGARPQWPFLPPLSTDFFRAVKSDPISWLTCCIQEFINDRSHFSSYFKPINFIPTPGLLSNLNKSLKTDRVAVLGNIRMNHTLYLKENHDLFNP
jgi:FkbM family methyltransferase